MNTLEEVIKTYGTNWEQNADRLRELMDNPHAVDEAYVLEVATDEGTGDNGIPDDIRADMRGHL